MNNFFDNQRIFTIIWDRKYHFIVIGLIAIVLAAIFSGPVFIRPKYKSTARIYPTNIGVMSEESRTEQMLEVITSRDIKFRIINSFSLDTVYKVKRDDPLYQTQIMNRYNENIRAAKTKFETVEIAVLDYDPVRASSICDSIIQFFNQKMRNMHRIKDWEMVELLSTELGKRRVDLDSVSTELSLIRKDFGILDYRVQAERVTEGYMTALANGRSSSADIKKIQDLYNNLAEKGVEARILEAHFGYLVSSMDSIARLRDRYISEFEKEITYSHIVEHPVPADKKSYPVRWLIVAFSLFSAIFLALIVFLILDYKKSN
ncbi:MAG TPA: Wzz/FepE/Etk N-terminal domain-containing protein [Mariniphaga sp.]|nr:Wzz/FepE/Etk N-terminal domain-containing protein [Mariniphaga sp.]